MPNIYSENFPPIHSSNGINSDSLFRRFFFCLFMLSFFFQSLYIEVGFGLMPFMLVSLMIPFVSRKIYRLNFIDGSLIIFVALYLFTITYSDYNENTIRFFLGFLLYLFLYFLIHSYLIFNKLNFEKMLGISGIIFSLTSLLLYLYGLLITDFSQVDRLASYGIFYDRGMPRLMGLINNPNFYCFFNAPFLALLGINAWKESFSLHFSKAVLLLGCSALTFSIPGIAVSLFIYFLSSHMKVGRCRSGARNFWLTVSCLIVFVSIAVLWFVSKEFIAAMNAIWEGRVRVLEHGSGRYAAWTYLLGQLDGVRLIFGYGIGASVTAIRAYEDIYNSHSTYVDIVYEGGVLLLFALFAFQLLTLRCAWQLYKSNQALGYLFASLLGVYLLMFSVSGILHEIFWFLLVALSAKLSIAKQSRNNHTDKRLVI